MFVLSKCIAVRKGLSTSERGIFLGAQNMSTPEQKPEFVRSKILQPTWFYDELINFEYTNIDQARRGSEADHTLKNMRIAAAEKGLQSYLRAKPFLIGAATLESLLNERPLQYDYIREGKIPFDHIFFEFAEPCSLEVPFLNTRKNIRGMLFKKQPSTPDYKYAGDYAADLHYSDSRNDMWSLGINFNSMLQGIFRGSLTNLLHLQTMPITFCIDMNKGVIYYDASANMEDYARRILEIQRKVDPSLKDPSAVMKTINESEQYIPLFYPEKEEIDSFEHNEVFFQIPNLCVNLVNYINAHNVTVVRREREVIYLDKDERGNKKVRRSKQPFHLIVVQDKVIEEPEEPREVGHWELRWRVYVRGHDRRYRDETGNIRMTTWIDPYIKGPSDAPWREQRYVVLAERLKREREMMRKYRERE